MASRCTHPCNWMAMTCSDVEHRSAIRRWLLASLLLVAPMAIAAESGQDETSTSAASTAVADVAESGQDETVASAAPTAGKPVTHTGYEIGRASCRERVCQYV